MCTLQSAGDFTRKVNLKKFTGTKVRRVSLFSVTEKQIISGFYSGLEFGMVGRYCRFASLGRQE